MDTRDDKSVHGVWYVRFNLATGVWDLWTIKDSWSPIYKRFNEERFNNLWRKVRFVELLYEDTWCEPIKD